MIINLIVHNKSVEFDFLKENHTYHLKIIDHEDDGITEGVGGIPVAQYTNERLHLMAANLTAYIEENVDPEFTAHNPSETLEQMMARELINVNAKFGEEDLSDKKFVLF